MGTILTNVVQLTRDATLAEKRVIFPGCVNRLRNPSAFQTGTATSGQARIQGKPTRKYAT